VFAPPSGSGAEPQPKSNLVHFSLKIWHLVAKILMILAKSQLTEKLVVYTVNTIFTISQFIESWQHQYLLRCNCCVTLPPRILVGTFPLMSLQTKILMGYVPGIPGGVDAYV